MGKVVGPSYQKGAMSTVSFSIPCGLGEESAEIPEANFAGLGESRVNELKPGFSGEELMRQALDNPLGSPRLEELAASARSAVVIASDHTRPVPSKTIMPQLLARLRKGNPSIEVSILIATGCHRETTREELAGKFGEDILRSERILIHDCRDEAAMASLGTLPSGGELKVNRLALDCDLLLSEGFIEPHFFAGFSGGRKSVLPGIASERTVMGNHCAKFISDPASRAGVLEGNPIHKDMVFAARKANLKFIANVVINARREIIHAVAGDPVEAHEAGCSFLKGLCGVELPEADIVVTGNGGYPLDQNIYQAVKGMSAAETVCRPGGVIVMVSDCADGHGGESFFKILSEAKSPAALLKEIEAVPQERTAADQWQVQILARILSRFTVVLVSGKCPASMAGAMHMRHASTLSEGLSLAFSIMGPSAKVSVMPDGVAVMPVKLAP